MPIEFPCAACGKLLRTPDEAVGRSARCPACGSVMTVPDRTVPPEAGTFLPAGENPFTSAAPNAESSFNGPAAPDGPDDFINPYQAPAEATPSSPFSLGEPPIERVRAPAICMIVMASLGLAVGLGFATLYAVIFVMMLGEPEFRNRPQEVLLGFGIWIGYGLFMASLAALTLFGAIKMKNLQSYGLSMTAAILLIIPCFTPCGILGTPFGIWAVIVLANAEVRDAFR